MTKHVVKSLITTLKKFRNLFDGNVIGGFQRSLRGVQQLADVAVFHVVEITQIEDGALDVGQRTDSLLQHGLRLVTVEIVVCNEHVGNATVHVVGILQRHVLLLAKEVDALVDGNAVEPRGEARFLMEVVQMGPRLDEHVL